ncbi:HD domain-containing phosphohydrolase [Paenibacillus sp. GCM10027628]|uniref:bifunctional diguanylate cyclase/phosphohydrolase n=1 Tax=Paenibacillus sp. GCM10027628 TaxID=3273413 RepID=UPI0036416CDB
MEAARKIITRLYQPSNCYALLVILTGAFVFVASFKLSLPAFTLNDWVMIYSLVAAVLILHYFIFQLPPEGNYQSMDSSVFLATIFVFGTGFALTVLLLSELIVMLFDRRTKWWQHLVNFSIYTLMISGASLVYYFFGGELGQFDSNHLYAYLFALMAYFCTNVVLIGIYFFLLHKGKLFDIIWDFFKDALFAYLSTLLLSIVLVVLVTNNRYFGLFLFLAIASLLSHAFRRLFLMYNELSEKANKDHRTGLFSHSYFEEKLEQAIREYREQDRPFSLALLDLDDFRKYNDAFGHPQGDKLLSFFGKLIKVECESRQLLAARYGGEEFAIIMPEYSKAKAFAYLNELRKKINDTPFDGVEVFPHGCISFSAGIYEVSRDNYYKSQLVDLADRALSMAKEKGKNTVLIYGEQSQLPQSIEQEIHDLEQQLKIFLSKDVYTFKHSKRVYSYAVDMAEVLELSDDDRRLLILGALIHDIGKLEIPRDVLNKKSKLTADEWEMVKKHVLWGKEIVLATGKYKDLVPLVELHHERYDGTGYPYGLKNEEIPKLARLLCIIDSFDAMTTERPYQVTKTIEEAIEELQRFAGKQFDPELVVPFIQYIQTKMTTGLTLDLRGSEEAI